MIKETKVKKSRTDLTRQLFNMKMDTKICFWNVKTLRKPPSDISRAALEWNPLGTRKRGRPRTRWRRTVLKELKPEKKRWAEVKALAANRTRWRIFTRALCSTKE
jgi:hypothetical protein